MPQADIEERLTFYGEMLEDRMEEGLSEEEAVSAAGPVSEIVAQAVADIPLARLARERIRPRRRPKAWEIVLLALGSPIWLSLAVAAIAVILAVYVSLWAVFAALAVCAVGSVPACVILAAGGSGAPGAAMLAAGIVCAGLSVFMFYGCKQATRRIALATKKFAMWIKNRLIKKGETE